MKQHLTLMVASCALVLLSSCGGGSFPAGSPDAAGSPEASLSAASLTFGSEIVGTASPAQSIILRNDGTAKLSIVSIAASTNFAAATNCGPALASGTKCVISVTFTPKDPGPLDGTLSVADNAAGSPQTVSLSGTGTLTGPRCSAQGQECGGGPLPPCCPGLACVPASTRAFCEP